MKVTLIQATQHPIKLITDVASICYGKEEAAHPEKLLMHLFKNGHHSTFEHVYYTFKIEGISRVTLAQLTRHRHASYSVRSQRYCSEEDAAFLIPDSFEEKGFDPTSLLNDINVYYDRLIASGVKKEDARFILPQAITTDLYMSMNLRELLHIYKLRTHSSAQWEINELVTQMVEEVIIDSDELKILFEEVID